MGKWIARSAAADPGGGVAGEEAGGGGGALDGGVGGACEGGYAVAAVDDDEAEAVGSCGKVLGGFVGVGQ